MSVNKSWGTLHGVRPTKIVHSLLDDGLGYAEVREFLIGKKRLHEDKAELLISIARKQRKMDNFIGKSDIGRGAALSLYIGIPFCPSRCVYCSFSAQERYQNESIMSQFLKTLHEDIKKASELIGELGARVQTLYIGGGTPTVLHIDELESLFKVLREESAINFSEIKEITVEAGRADSLNKEKINFLQKYGIHRIAVNPQTMHDKTLQLIGRKHTVAEFEASVQLLQKTSQFSLSMDVIAGLPDEEMEDFQETLQKVAAMRPQNITVHNLAIKQGSLMKSAIVGEAGEIKELYAENQETTKILQWGHAFLLNCGYQPYYLYRQKYTAGHEANIGYTLSGYECLYNVQVMEERQNIIGIGAGAMSKYILPYDENTKKYALNSYHYPKDVSAYIKNIGRNAEKRRQVLLGAKCY